MTGEGGEGGVIRHFSSERTLISLSSWRVCGRRGERLGWRRAKMHILRIAGQHGEGVSCTCCECLVMFLIHWSPWQPASPLSRLCRKLEEHAHCLDARTHAYSYISPPPHLSVTFLSLVFWVIVCFSLCCSFVFRCTYSMSALHFLPCLLFPKLPFILHSYSSPSLEFPPCYPFLRTLSLINASFLTFPSPFTFLHAVLLHPHPQMSSQHSISWGSDITVCSLLNPQTGREGQAKNTFNRKNGLKSFLNGETFMPHHKDSYISIYVPVMAVIITRVNWNAFCSSRLSSHLSFSWSPP